MPRPHHSTLAAYLALFVAVGTGGAYAVELVASDRIENNSIRSVDLKNRRAVSGRDVRRDALTGTEVRESSLDGSGLVQVAGVNDALDCDPTGADAIDCVAVTVSLDRPARLLVVVSGGMFGVGGGAAGASCEIRIDEQQRPIAASPGELSSNTAAGSTDGFARTLVTDDPLPAGTHEIALACSELDPDVRIATPTIAAIAISAG